jgi:predicted Zn-dependent protease
VFYGWQFVVQGKPDEALPHYRRAFDLDPGSPLLNFLWGFALTRSGRTAEAAAHFEHVGRAAGPTVFGDLARAFRHALQGEFDAARQAITPATAAVARADEAIARFLALLHATIGDTAQVCTWVEHAVARGNLDYPSLAHDSIYLQTRSDPRFQRLLADVKARWEAFEV